MPRTSHHRKHRASGKKANQNAPNHSANASYEFEPVDDHAPVEVHPSSEETPAAQKSGVKLANKGGREAHEGRRNDLKETVTSQQETFGKLRQRHLVDDKAGDVDGQIQQVESMPRASHRKHRSHGKNKDSYEFESVDDHAPVEVLNPPEKKKNDKQQKHKASEGQRTVSDETVTTQQEIFGKPPARETSLEEFSKLSRRRLVDDKAGDVVADCLDHANLAYAAGASSTANRHHHNAPDAESSSHAAISKYGGMPIKYTGKFFLLDVRPSFVPNYSDPALAAHFPRAAQKMNEFLFQSLPPQKQASVSLAERLTEKKFDWRSLGGVSAALQDIKNEIKHILPLKSNEKDRNDLKYDTDEPQYWRRAHVAFLAEKRRAAASERRSLRLRRMVDQSVNFHRTVWLERVHNGRREIDDEAEMDRKRQQIELHEMQAEKRRMSLQTDLRLKLTDIDLGRKLKVEHAHDLKKQQSGGSCDYSATASTNKYSSGAFGEPVASVAGTSAIHSPPDNAAVGGGSGVQLPRPEESSVFATKNLLLHSPLGGASSTMASAKKAEDGQSVKKNQQAKYSAADANWDI